MTEVSIPSGYTSGSFEYATSIGRLTRPVHRHDASGPTVILIHEMPGLTTSTFAIGDVLLAQGYRVVLPVLLDAGGSGPFRQVTGMFKLCIARELSALSAGRTGAIVEWLRGLADEEARATDGRPVGVIGMCFSGGFALGAITNPNVHAAVMSQPALPFMLPFRGSDLGVSKEDLATIHERVGAGGCIRAMRFSRDRVSPRARLDLIHEEFPDAECRQVETEDASRHSVLRLAVERTDNVELQNALSETLTFLDRHLNGVPA